MWSPLQNARIATEEKGRTFCMGRKNCCCQLFNGKEVERGFKTVDNLWQCLHTSVIRRGARVVLEGDGWIHQDDDHARDFVTALVRARLADSYKTP